MGDFIAATPQESVGLQFWKLYQIWQKRIAETLTPVSISHTQFVILATLKWFQEQDVLPTQQQISDVSGIEKMTLSKAIRQLENKSFLVRKISERDSRSFSLLLTKTGKQSLVSAIKKVEAIDLEVFGVLGREKSIQLSKRLLEINEALGC